MDNTFDLTEVQIRNLKLLYDYIKDRSPEIRGELDNIVEAYNRINDYWECDDWDTAYANLADNAQSMDDIVSELEDYKNKLETIIDNYSKTEEANKGMLDSLPYNVIR